MNFPDGLYTYVPERDCPNGACIVDETERQIAILRSSQDDAARLQAVKYVVHFLGDLHQPSHAGHVDDRGSNQYQVQAFGPGSKLHALWDTGMVKNIGPDPSALEQRLLGMPVMAVRMDGGSLVIRAAEESCQIVAQPGFYPSRIV